MERRCTYDPLHELMAYYADAGTVTEKQHVEASTIEEKLRQRIINGDRLGIDEDLRKALGELYRGADELHTGLTRAREGGQQLSSNSAAAVEAATRLRAGAAQLAEGTQQLGGGVRQMGSSLRAIEARRPPEAELAALRLGLAAQVDGQRELLRGLEGLLDGSRQLQGGLGQFREAADDVPLIGGRLVEGLAPLTQGAQQLGTGLDQARAGQVRLLQGAVRLQEGVGA
ncbi:MAG: hypothetical protein ACKOB6_08660, partial [Candidatus Kapaibacterium sp.]